jgi:hypothetical protein
VQARGDTRRGGCVTVGLGCKSEPDSCWRSGTTLTGESRLSAKEEGGEKELARAGRWAGEGASRPRAVEGEERKKASWAGPQGGKKNTGEEKEGGSGSKRNKGRKRITF